MKLIHWATCTMGVAVTNLTDKLDIFTGGFAGFVTTKTAITHRLNYSDEMRIFKSSYPPCLLKSLRLAPAKQQPWLAYEEGVTIVPEWAEFELKVKDYKKKFLGHPQIDPDLYTESFSDRVIDSNVAYLTGQAYAYRITGVKDGWTDEPSEVTE